MKLIIQIGCENSVTTAQGAVVPRSFQVCYELFLLTTVKQVENFISFCFLCIN